VEKIDNLLSYNIYIISMVSILPNEINLNIVNYMDLYCLLKSYLYIDYFKDLIDINTLDSLIDKKLAVYHISIKNKDIFKNNKEKLFRFLKYVSHKAPYIACDIANMDDNQYNKFDYLSNNGIDYIFAEMASKYSYNLNQNQIDKIIEIYKFIQKNQHSELFICYDTIIKIVKTFNKEQIEDFYYLYQNKFKIKLAYDIINNININDIIKLNKDGCPDYLICPVLTNFDISKRQDFLDKIKSGMNPLDTYKFIKLI
jgi:hypothetical protein